MEIKGSLGVIQLRKAAKAKRIEKCKQLHNMSRQEQWTTPVMEVAVAVGVAVLVSVAVGVAMAFG